jgi:hypothetical protein
MGIVFKIVLGWSLLMCILASSLVVILYTIWGGMWSISITDFIQTIMIIVGLLIVAAVLYQEVGGFKPLIDAAPDGFFRFFPENTLKGHLEYFRRMDHHRPRVNPSAGCFPAGNVGEIGPGIGAIDACVLAYVPYHRATPAFYRVMRPSSVPGAKSRMAR